MKQEIYNQAYNDGLSIRITTKDSVSLVFRGVKVENKNDNIRILNMGKGGDFYREVTQEQYKIFFDKGFRQGVYEVNTSNYKDTLDMLSTKIRNEVASRNNLKHYNMLKEYRNMIMQKLSEIIKLKAVSL